MTSRQTNLRTIEGIRPGGVTLPLMPVGAVRAGGRTEAVYTDYSLTRRALGLAIGSLLLAGCFSLLLMIGRMPVGDANTS